MSRNKDKGRLPPFVPLFRETMASAAWRTSSPYARLIYVALKARYSINLRNNGRIYLSARTAAEETGLDKTTVARGFHELQHYGFIVMTAAGSLGVDGKGKAPHWRLTELGYKTDPPTRDFLRWDGVIFRYQKKQNPVRPERTPRPSRADIPLSVPSGHSDTKLSVPSGHTDDPACPCGADITSLTTPMLVTADVQADDWRRNSKTAAERLDDGFAIPGFLRRTVN